MNNNIIPGNITYTKHYTGNTIAKIVHTIIVTLSSLLSISQQESINVVETASSAAVPQPLILWNGMSCFVIAEKEVVCTVPEIEAPVGLMAAYYNFNIAYPKSSQLLGTFLDIVLLDKVPKKVPSKVSALLSAIKNVLV